MGQLIDSEKLNKYLACWRSHYEVSINILFTKLFGNVQSQRAIIIINVSLREITQNTVGPINIFELKQQMKVRNILNDNK